MAIEHAIDALAAWNKSSTPIVAGYVTPLKKVKNSHFNKTESCKPTHPIRKIMASELHLWNNKNYANNPIPRKRKNKIS